MRRNRAWIVAMNYGAAQRACGTPQLLDDS
jgi:hypothetical protein